jgi:hypothetical protein
LALKRLRSRIVEFAGAEPILSTATPDVRQAIAGNIRESLARIGDKSFRTTLTEFLDSSDPLPEKQRDNLVQAFAQVRNLLVHEGRFLDSDDWPGHEQYALLHWVAARCCTRAIGLQAGFEAIPEHVQTSVAHSSTATSRGL